MRRTGVSGPIRALAVLFAVFALQLGGADAASAESFTAAEQSIDKRLKQSLRELSSVRATIAKEKIPLSKSVARLEDKVAALRREKTRLVTVLDSGTIDLASLQKRTEALSDQSDFIDSRLSEFVRDFESRLDISEIPRFEATTGAAKRAEKNINLDAEGKRNAQLEVVEIAIDRLRRQLGGEVFAGEALSPTGLLTEGKFVAFGPNVFYASNDGTVTGLVENQLNAADPVVVDLPGDMDGGIAAIITSGTGFLPLDATLGKALKVEKARKGLLAYVQDGGAVGYVILGLGITALLLTGFKAYEILSFEVADPNEVDTILDHVANGKLDDAEHDARRVPGVAGEMLVTGVEHAEEKRSVLEELLFEKILRVRPALERYLPLPRDHRSRGARSWVCSERSSA